MIKLFTERKHYTPQNRKYLIDVLRPLIPENHLVSKGIDTSLVAMTNSPEECDFMVLPMAWNYYLEHGLKQEAQKFIKLGKQKKKKIIICVRGDYYYPLPESDNIISFYYSSFKSKANNNTFTLPVIVRDPLDSEDLQKSKYRKFGKIPQVGFCGHVDSNFGVSLAKCFSLLLAKNLGKILITINTPDSVIPPTYLRRKILDEVEKSSQIKTNFIKNHRYKGGRKNSPEMQAQIWNQFKNNILENDYTLCMRGTGNFSARFYETLALGRIPIFINTDCQLPFEDEINWRNHLIWLDYKELSTLNETILKFHKKLDGDSFLSLQKNNRKLWEKYFSFSGFYSQFISQLERIKQN